MMLSVNDWASDYDYSRITHKLEREVGIEYGRGGRIRPELDPTNEGANLLCTGELPDPVEMIIEGPVRRRREEAEQAEREAVEQEAEDERQRKLDALLEAGGVGGGTTEDEGKGSAKKKPGKVPLKKGAKTVGKNKDAGKKGEAPKSGKKK